MAQRDVQTGEMRVGELKYDLHVVNAIGSELVEVLVKSTAFQELLDFRQVSLGVGAQIPSGYCLQRSSF
jgi:hypothetical protein